MSKLLGMRLTSDNKQKITSVINTSSRSHHQFHTSITREKCHPIFNGYRENVVYYDKTGAPKLKKIIFNCIKCSMIADALYNNEKSPKNSLKK